MFEAGIGISLLSGIAQSYEANQANIVKQREIREQSVQLRLQQNQASINRLKNLQSTLAQEEVTFGSRNIAPGSGSVRAISMENMHEFYEDENADRLNFASKQLALARESDMSRMKRNATYLNSFIGAAGVVVSNVYNHYQVPSNNLIKASLPKPEFGATGGESQGEDLMDLNA